MASAATLIVVAVGAAVVHMHQVGHPSVCRHSLQAGRTRRSGAVAPRCCRDHRCRDRGSKGGGTSVTARLIVTPRVQLVSGKLLTRQWLSCAGITRIGALCVGLRSVAVRSMPEPERIRSRSNGICTRLGAERISLVPAMARAWRRWFLPMKFGIRRIASPARRGMTRQTSSRSRRG